MILFSLYFLFFLILAFLHFSLIEFNISFGLVESNHTETDGSHVDIPAFLVLWCMAVKVSLAQTYPLQHVFGALPVPLCYNFVPDVGYYLVKIGTS